MTIFEIDSKISELLSMTDPETGELKTDFAAVEALQMERDTKVENLACAVKNLKAEAAAIKAEAENLTKRARAAEAEAKRAKDYLLFILRGEKFKSAKVAVSYTRSKSIETDSDFVDWAMTNAEQFLRYKAPEPNKDALKAALEAGEEIPHASIVEKVSVTVR